MAHNLYRYHPIKEADLETIYIQLYDSQSPDGDAQPSVYIHSHNLAVFCLVIALGALVDLNKPKMSPQAHEYFQLGRAALALDSVLEEHSIAAIQALVRFQDSRLTAMIVHPDVSNARS